MKVYAEETFGPVVPVIPYRTDSEAIAIANDSEYGLSSGVITRDESRGLAIAAALETGMCHINCSSVNDEPRAVWRIEIVRCQASWRTLVDRDFHRNQMGNAGAWRAWFPPMF